jgi:hypothetical protein
MPDILELTPFDMPRLHRQGRGGTLQGLNAGHLVDRHGVYVEPDLLIRSGPLDF